MRLVERLQTWMFSLVQLVVSQDSFNSFLVIFFYMTQSDRLFSRHQGVWKLYLCGVIGRTWCQTHTRRKSELCVHEMSLWNRNGSKTGRKAFYW